MPVTSARGAPPLHPPGPTLQTTSDPHSAPTTTSEISTVAYTVYRDKDLSKLLVGDAPVIPPSNEMMVFTRVPPDLSIFDFVKAANQQIGPAYICRPIQSPNWASKTKDLGIVFDNKEHDQAAAMKGITVNDITYYPAINLPDNMKFRKYTVTNLPDIRRPQVNLIEPLLDLFSQYGQVARIDFIYRIKHLPDAVQFQTVRLFTNKSTIYTFIDESFDMDVQTPEPVMCLEYENRSYHVTSTWQGAKEFCKYCKQFDHSIALSDVLFEELRPLTSSGAPSKMS
ncbi:hypothetical protein BGX31_000981 [Mortierella sp. GBA43]|nr:hypothetical protein BGX31_000981 [Mortierella sp. GBA43]